MPLEEKLVTDEKELTLWKGKRTIRGEEQGCNHPACESTHFRANEFEALNHNNV